MKLKIKKLSGLAVMPTYATVGSACFDLYATEDGTIWPKQAVTFATDLAFEVPEGWVLKIYSRSGHGFKHGVRLVNTTGIIDSDYRGHVPIGQPVNATSFNRMALRLRYSNDPMISSRSVPKPNVAETRVSVPTPISGTLT